MKKSLVLFLFSLVAVLAPCRVDAANANSRAKEYISRVETCEAILQEFMGRPETAIPMSVFSKARAIVIANQFKAGFLLGVQDGFGIIMVKRADGRWSVPALLKAGDISLGFQMGANATNTIYIFTDDQTPRILFNQRLNVGVDAKAVAGPHFADSGKDSRPVIDTPVLVYTKKAGLYAGATVKSGYMVRDDEANRILYKTNFNLPELLYSDWITPIPEVQPIMSLVTKYSP